jgi:hypothetical protein
VITAGAASDAFSSTSSKGREMAKETGGRSGKAKGQTDDPCPLGVNSQGTIPPDCNCRGGAAYVQSVTWKVLDSTITAPGIEAIVSGQPGGGGGTTPIRIWPGETDDIKAQYWSFLTDAQTYQWPVFFVTAWPNKLEWICKIGRFCVASSSQGLPPNPVP